MFIPLAGKLVGSLVAEGKIPERASALELGAQTYSVDPQTIRALQELLREKGKRSLADALERFAEIAPAKKPRDMVPHMREFFEALGFASYDAIDISDYGGTIIMDLNEDIAKTNAFSKTYDLVTNIGVSEHLINQYHFFKNAHNVTKVGGYMLHILPSVSYANHGFFNYQPRFFQDLAAANGYDLVDLYFSDRSRKVLDLMNPSYAATYFYFAAPALPSDKHGNLFCAALLRKKTDAPFATPLQGKYVKDVTDATYHENYASSESEMKHRQVPTKGFFAAGELSRMGRIGLRIRLELFELLRKAQRALLS